MHKTRFNSIFLLFVLSNICIQTQAQQSIQYNFRNSFNETNNLAPALNNLSTGNFVIESLPELSCLTRPVYSFAQNSGVQFDNGAAGNFLNTTYTIETYFKFTINTGFMRVMDFKNRTSDFGMYATTTSLDFYPDGSYPTTVFSQPDYVHLVLSRDGTTGDVKIYINGQFLAGFNDVNSNALLDASNVLNFFQDDFVFGGESRPGNIALLKLYDFVLDGATVSDNFSKLKTVTGTLAFEADILSSCLTGNVFNFTNESLNNSSPTYEWIFGDGNNFFGTDASHSYLLDGTFTVQLIADDGAGCTDTVTNIVEVLPAPPLDLGFDYAFCIGEQALLDAGQGFQTYLWSDGSSDPTLITGLPGIYSVTITDTNGCRSSDEIELSVSDPSFSLGNDTTICFGATIDLSAPVGMSDYIWNTFQTDQFITVGFSGIYAVEITNLEGCVASDTIEVTVNSDIILSLGNDTIVCDGQAVTFDAGLGFADYLWNDGTTNSSLTTTVAGIYSVTVTDNFGCTKAAAVELIVYSAPVVDLGVDVTICGGTNLVLDAGTGFNAYLWNDGTTGQTISVQTAGLYTVTVTDAIGCEGVDVVEIYTDPYISLGNDLVLCDGQTATLDPLALYTTYLWNDGTTQQTLDVTVSGTYTLTVTDINGCINSDSVIVTFNLPPAVDLGPDIDICDGSSVDLDAGIGFTTYEWNDGTPFHILNVVAPGSYTVTVTDFAGCSNSDNITVGVLPSPVVDLGPGITICPGTGTLLDAGSGFSDYLWNDGSTSQLLLTGIPGTYTVTVTNSSGCSAIDNVSISQFTAPVVSLGSDTLLCANDSIQLDAGSGFNTYLWNDGSTLQTLYATLTGTYMVTVTDGNGCQDFDDVDVIFYAPVPVPTILQIGNTLQSSSATGNQWYSVTTGLIPGATGNMYDPLLEDTYYVIVTDANGCVSEPSADFIFLFDGINDPESWSFLISPNPASSLFTISVKNYNTPGKVKIEVVDLSGKCVISEIHANEPKIVINAEALEQGIYLIRLASGKSVVNRKLIIAR
jgi:hypothetical protein